MNKTIANFIRINNYYILQPKLSEIERSLALNLHKHIKKSTRIKVFYICEMISINILCDQLSFD